MRKTRQRCFIEKLSLKRLMTFAVMLCMLFSAVLMPAAYANEYDISVQSEEQVLADGVYYIKKGDSYFTSNLTFQTSKYTSVPDSLTQMWKIYHVGDGSYTIRPMDSLSCCLNGAGTQLQLYSDPVDDVDELMAHSRWLITEATEGYQITIYTYKWKLSEFLISIPSGSWTFERVTSPPSGVLLKRTQSWIAPKSTATFRAAVYSGSTIDQSVTWNSSNTNVAKVDSAGIVTGVSQGTATITAKSTYNTSWQKSFTVNVSLVPNGTYYIQSVASKSKVVDIKDSNTNEGESIHQFDYEGTTDQRWIFELQQDGYYTIKSVYSNLYLSVKNNSTSNGSEVVQSSGGSADGQRWSISTTSSGAYKLKAKCAGSQDLCLMKGTYIFYPNKLVHMAYTDNTTYDDEWYINILDENIISFIGITATGHDHASALQTSRLNLFYKDYNNIKLTLGEISCDTCKNEMKTADIFAIRCHGKPIYYENTEIASATKIILNNKTTNSEMICLYSHSTTSMTSNSQYITASDRFSNADLILFIGCQTAYDGENGRNLPAVVVSNGARVAIGFADEIGCVAANKWTEAFFLRLSEGDTVQEAAENATSSVSTALSSDSGLGSFVICGDKNYRLSH